MGPLDLADLEELKVKQGQQRDKIENAPKDKAIKATDKAHKAGNITDKEHIENLKNAPNYMQIIEDTFQTTKEGFKIGADAYVDTGKKVLDATMDMANDPAAMSEHTLDLYADFQAASKGFQAGSKFGPWGAGGGAVGAVILRRGGKELVDKVFGLLRKGDEYVDAATGMKVDPTDSTYFMSRTTPESTGRKILENKPISKGRQPGDYTLSELESAYRGSGREKNIKYSKAVRNQTTRIDLNLGKKLQERYGGTDAQVKEFIRNQIEAQKSVRQTLSTLNSKQRDYQISQLALKNLSKPELRKAIEKISKTTYYDLGHIRSAKNVFRYEELMGADRASNIFPEISQNVIDYSKTTGKPLRVVEKGNLSRGARSDIPDDILTMTGTSRTIDEEYLKFIDPELGNMVSELIDPKMQDRLFNIVQERWKRFSSAGYPDFAEFLDEVHGMKYYKYNKLPQTKKNALRIEFNKQKEPVIGKQQQMLFKPFVRKVVDEYIGSVQAGRELSEYTKKGLANTNVTDLLKMLRITNE